MAQVLLALTSKILVKGLPLAWKVSKLIAQVISLLLHFLRFLKGLLLEVA